MTNSKESPKTIEDILNDDIFGLLHINEEEMSLFVEPNHYESKARASYNAKSGEITAKQKVCADFKLYEPIINRALSDIAGLPYSQAATKEDRISVGDIFVLSGMVACVVAVNKSEDRNSGQKFRAHLVYSNGTESKLLFSSLVSATHKTNSYLVKFN